MASKVKSNEPSFVYVREVRQQKGKLAEVLLSNGKRLTFEQARAQGYMPSRTERGEQAAEFVARNAGLSIAEARERLTDLAARVGVLCSGPHPEGPRPATVGDLCTAHDQQKRRHPRRALRPLRTLPGEGDKITFRLPGELRERAAADAKRQKVDEGEWWRRAGRNQLDRKGDE